MRALKGGAWLLDQKFARSAFRNWYFPYLRYDFIGFRVMKRVKGRHCEMRGGAWYDSQNSVRSTVRLRNLPYNRYDLGSFRVMHR